MIHNICSGVYTASADFGNKTIEISKSLVNKTVEIARKTFDAISQFFLGFCAGFSGLYLFLHIQEPLLAYSLHPVPIALAAVSLGLCLGIAYAKDS